MKPIFCAGILLAVAAQAVSPAMTNAAALPAPTPWVAASRDASSTVWQRTAYEQKPDGSIVPKSQEYTEIGSGLNHLVNNQWLPSSDQIVLSPDGASALAANCQHQVTWPGDILGADIKMITPQGEVVESEPISLNFSDGTNTVILAMLTNSTGAILPSGNQVIYSNAFPGLADLVYSNSLSGLAQDIVLRAAPNPASCGLNPANTRLQVVTEFFPSSPPSVTPATTMTPIGNLEDDNIAFGTMHMVRGKAFALGTNSPSAIVTKRWIAVSGRQFLIEDVPYVSISQGLTSLPPYVADGDGSLSHPRFVQRRGSLPELLALVPPALRGRGPSGGTSVPRLKAARMQLAQAAPPGNGLVLDYTVFNGSLTNFVFQGDTTYEITNTVNVFSNSFSFEGNAVLKYAPGASLNFIGDGRSTPQIHWLASAYHPVIFTAVSDNTVGQTVQTGSPSGYYANPALTLGAIPNFSLDGLRISYAQMGLNIFGYGGKLADAQFVNCQQGIQAQDTAQAPIWIENALFANVRTNFNSLAEVSVVVENSTIANNSYLETGQTEYYTNYASVYLTNCILANATAYSFSYYDTISLDHTGSYNSSPSGSFTCTQNPFQTAGGGNYYLNTNANGGGKFLGVGTTNIDPVLLAALQTKTTRPPNTNYVGQTISTDSFTNLVARDGESPGPDLGYHYDALDYVFSNSTVSSTTMTFPAGAAVGWQGLGLTFTAICTNNFNGTVVSNDYFVRCNTVQEADPSGDHTGIAGTNLPSGFFSPTVKATFTRFSALGTNATFFNANINEADVCNSEFWDGFLGGSGAGYAGFFLFCTNCLFDRSALDFPAPVYNNDFHSQNCTLHGGSLAFNASASFGLVSSNVVTDSAFDRTAITVTDPSAGVFNCSNNAYLTNATTLPSDSGDITNLTNFNWLTGPRGNFYLPHDPGANDGTKLIDSGNQPATNILVTVDGSWGAAEPLSTFTTQTNQTADTNTVDIGYHYPIRFPEPPVLVSANSANQAEGIETYDFSSGVLITNFIPQSVATNQSASGRGLAIYNTNFYYTEWVNNGFTTIRDNIHICSYNTNGSGSTNDSGSISNRDTRTDVYTDQADIAGLAFHYDTNTMKTELYALSGYGLLTQSGGTTNYAEVWEIDPSNGMVVAGTTNILTSVAEPGQSPLNYASSDGFMVLTNGDFLVNDYDGAAGGAIYREYYGFNAPAGKTSGTQVPGGLQIDLSIYGLNYGTGVTISPDGKSFYFCTAASGTTNETLVQTDLSGNLLGTQPINIFTTENIAVAPK